MNPTLLYVYCLVSSARRPAIGARVGAAGMPGSRDTRALAGGDGLWVIVATVPAAQYGEEALAAGLQDLDWVGRCAMAHESVVEQFLSARAVLPMQLFTLFTSEARALEDVSERRRDIAAIIRRLDGKLEWGLRLTFDEKAAREAIEARWADPIESGSRPTPRRETPAAITGLSYLTRKRELLNVTRVQLRAAQTEADRFFAALTKDASESRRRTATEQAVPGSRLLLDAAFLVPTTRSRSFRAAVARRTKELGSAGVAVSLTGPWPPYNFIAPSVASRKGALARSRGKSTR